MLYKRLVDGHDAFCYKQSIQAFNEALKAITLRVTTIVEESIAYSSGRVHAVGPFLRLENF